MQPRLFMSHCVRHDDGSAPFPTPVLACDFGGTWIKFGWVRNGKVLVQDRLRVLYGAGLAKQLPQLKAAFEELGLRMGLHPRDAAGIVFGLPCIVDFARNRVEQTFDKFTDATKLNLSAWVRRAWGIPTAMENDARMALVAEWRHGAGRGCQNAVMVTLGTGVGTAVLLEGKILRGQRYQAGNLGGIVVINYDARHPAGCFQGTAEGEASSHALPGIIRRHPGYKKSMLADETDLTFATLIACASRRDKVSREIFERVLDAWSAVMVNMVRSFDAERVIVGGGIMKAADVILPALRKRMKRHLGPSARHVEIVTGRLGDHAALLGAEWLLWDKLGQRK